MNTLIQTPTPKLEAWLMTIWRIVTKFNTTTSNRQGLNFRNSTKAQKRGERPVDEVIKILEAELLAETIHYHTFMTLERKRKLGYRVLPVKDNDGFHAYRILRFGINYSPDPYTALSEFYKERNQWLEHSWRMRAQIDKVASLSVSTWPHPGKAGSALP